MLCSCLGMSDPSVVRGALTLEVGMTYALWRDRRSYAILEGGALLIFGRFRAA